MDPCSAVLDDSDHTRGPSHTETPRELAAHQPASGHPLCRDISASAESSGLSARSGSPTGTRRDMDTPKSCRDLTACCSFGESIRSCCGAAATMLRAFRLNRAAARHVPSPVSLDAARAPISLPLAKKTRIPRGFGGDALPAVRTLASTPSGGPRWRRSPPGIL